MLNLRYWFFHEALRSRDDHAADRMGAHGCGCCHKPRCGFGRRSRPKPSVVMHALQQAAVCDEVSASLRPSASRALVHRVVDQIGLRRRAAGSRVSRPCGRPWCTARSASTFVNRRACATGQDQLRRHRLIVVELGDETRPSPLRPRSTDLSALRDNMRDCPSSARCGRRTPLHTSNRPPDGWRTRRLPPPCAD